MRAREPGPSDPSYNWDAEGRMQQIDSSSSSWTFDALGRWVEKANSGGSYVQAVYDPTGHLLAQMNNGPTLRQARVPLVGGAMAQYVWTGLNVYEHPGQRCYCVSFR